MPIVSIELPHVGESVVEGIIDRWLKKPGDRIKRYDSLVEVVTDKVNMEVPSPFDGVLTRILAEEGATIPMGAVIAEMETDDPAAVAQISKAPEEKVAGTVGVLVESDTNLGPTGAAVAEEHPAKPVSTARGAFYSPVVMKMAQEHNVDLSQVTGTGINGRVTKKDVLRYIESGAKTSAPTAPRPATEDDEEVVELKPVRRMIAQHMVQSASQIPHVWAMVEVDVTNLVSLRQSVREEFQKREGQDITALPFVIKAVVDSLKENPSLNSTWRDGKLVLKKRIHIGVAVSAPDGLVGPVIHDADTLTIAGINGLLRDMAERARQGKLNLDDVQGGTFTVNNTGALGTLLTQPIINYPQAGILTTESVQKRPVVINDAMAIRSMMNICLSFDHRILDGFEAATFLQSVKGRLENVGPDTPIY
ncbi:MAG: dihydrolipoamide acetyltransferase family protein [Dehalococcoidia bacterium]